MKIDINEKKDKPLLSRQEVRGTVIFDKATPSNDDFTANIAKQLSVELDRVVVKHINTRFGESKADFLVYVYNAKKDVDYFESKPTKWVEKMKKKEEAKKAKAAEAAKEAVKEVKEGV